MSQEPLKHVVREHVESHALDDTQLRALDDLMATSHARAPSPKPRRTWAIAVVAALLLLGIGATLFAISSTRPTQEPMELRIAQEVVRNHHKLKPLEVHADSIAQTSTFFTKLDFNLLTDSEVLSGYAWTLKGGRYCTIQGEDAAQLRFVGEDHTAPISVYMARYDARQLGEFPRPRHGEAPKRVMVQGIEVLIWVEEDVLLAATHAP